MKCLTAYHDDLRGQVFDDDISDDEGCMWIPHDDLTPNFVKLEEALVEDSRGILFDLSTISFVVIDGELISSRATDVQVRQHLFWQNKQLLLLTRISCLGCHSKSAQRVKRPVREGGGGVGYQVGW